MKQLDYSDAAPGANTTEYTLFDSTLLSKGVIAGIDGCRYRLSIKHNTVGTLKAYASNDRSTWVQFFERYVPAPAATKRTHEFSIPVGMHKDVKVTWVNGGSAQSTWYVAHALMSASEVDPIKSVLDVIPGPVSSLDNFAEAVSTTHFVRPVKTGWLGRCVRFRAQTANIWLVFGTADTVEADRAAVVSGASSSAWTGSVKIADRIPIDGFSDFYIDPSWTHFSAEGDAAGTLVGILSGYEQTDLPI
jgi:hypothetical protein